MNIDPTARMQMATIMPPRTSKLRSTRPPSARAVPWTGDHDGVRIAGAAINRTDRQRAPGQVVGSPNFPVVRFFLQEHRALVADSVRRFRSVQRDRNLNL